MKLKVLSIAVIIASSLFFSCSKEHEEENENLKMISSKKTELNDIFNFSSWQDMINYYKEGDGVIWFNNQGLRLLEYNVEGTTIINESLISSAKDAIMPIYSEEGTLESIKGVDNVSMEKLDNYLSTRKACLSLYKGENLGILKLKWEFKGQVFQTRAYVSRDIVVYDDIMYNVYTVNIKDKNQRRFKARLKTREEIISRPMTFSTDTVKYYIMARVVAEAQASTTVGYTENGFDVSNDCYYWSGSDLATADAKVRYEIVGNNCKLTYGAVAGSSDMSVTWTGNGFTISGDGYCDNRSWVVSKYEVMW